MLYKVSKNIKYNTYIHTDVYIVENGECLKVGVIYVCKSCSW